MKCPVCQEMDLVPKLTKQGVVVDICGKCGGIWLDKGEIYYFTKTPKYLEMLIAQAQKTAKPSARTNPYTHDQLLELELQPGLVIELCPKTQGIWLDYQEIEKIPAAKKLELKIELDDLVTTEPQDAKAQNASLVRLPNLGITSVVTLFSLYAIVTLALIILANFGIITAGMSLLIMVVFALIQFVFSPFIMDFTLQWFYRLEWTPVSMLPRHLRDFIIKISAENNIPVPRIGIIQDGSPNAFTYGHTPKNARIVITRGLTQLLEPGELEAVVAHEVGHAVHWDMLVMTIAYLVPMIMYYIYRTLIRMKSRGNDKSAGYRYLIALVAYILYIVSEYLVLWFSRIREFFADRFAGYATGNPDKLASALVKIGYGLAGKNPSSEQTERKPEMESLKAMGIFDPVSARALAVTSYNPRSMGREMDKELLKGAMRWDLWNPWAVYYELHSTHPLIAHRLQALGCQSRVMGKDPFIIFDENKPESYLDEFFTDLTIQSLPTIVVIAGLVAYFLMPSALIIKAGMILFGLASLAEVLFSYQSSFFSEMNVASLLKQVKVSRVRPIACKLRGKIIGRGVPGLVWSEDLVIQDQTGIMFLDYRQPLAIWSFFFGLIGARNYIGQEVEVTGWYRRSPVPFLEIKELRSARDTQVCYVFQFKLIFAIALILIGIIALFLF